ncbi:MAG: signal peptidase I [Kangiellaceae bacterium]|jgi:signal peptidase I|nr:signal peptidase I [Kangiellaceae bacterium]
MDFITSLITVLVGTSIISGYDILVARKARQLAMAEAKEKKPNADYNELRKLLLKPQLVEYSDSLFVMACVTVLVWAMLPNFELILVVALAISFVITLVEKLYLEKSKNKQLQELYQRNSNPPQQQVEDTTKMPWWIDYGWSFFPLLLIIVGLRSFFYEPFKIPSGSMKPTLWVHDFILVNKYAYGLRLPVTKTKLTAGDEPQRGEVVVFRAPHEPQKDYIKRMIALPGDKVFYMPNQDLYIEPNCSTDALAEQARSAGLNCGTKNKVARQLVKRAGFEGKDVYQESLGGFSYQTLIDRKRWPNYRYYQSHHNELNARYPNAPELVKRQFFAHHKGTYIEDWARGVVVPDGHYFVMGDNRNGSSDARFWGFVPEYRMVGRADAIWLHLEFGLAESGPLSLIPTAINFERIGAIE